VAYVIHDQTFTSVSGAEMERAAASLAQHGFLGNVYSPSSGPSAHVAPLYPTLLAGVYRALGWDTQTGRMAQEGLAIAATTLSVALLPVLATAAGFSPTSAYVAAALMAVLPLSLWVESSGSWEQPYAAAWLLWSTSVFLRLHREASLTWRDALLGGVAVGVGALLSPTLLPALGLMALAAVGRRRATHLFAVTALVAIVILLPWTIRNWYVMEAFVPLRSNLGLELAIGNRDGANGKTFGTAFNDPASPMYQLHPFTSRVEREKLESAGEIAYMAGRMREATGWITAHPGEFLRLSVVRFRLFWFPPQDLWAPGSPGVALKAIVATLAAALMFTGLVIMAWRRQSTVWILSSAVLGPSVMYVVTHIDPRYRYVVSGLTMLIAVETVRWLIDSVRASRTRTTEVAIGE
jgi:hypothetical protein